MLQNPATLPELATKVIQQSFRLQCCHSYWFRVPNTDSRPDGKVSLQRFAVKVNAEEGGRERGKGKRLSRLPVSFSLPCKAIKAWGKDNKSTAMPTALRLRQTVHKGCVPTVGDDAYRTFGGVDGRRNAPICTHSVLTRFVSRIGGETERKRTTNFSTVSSKRVKSIMFHPLSGKNAKK